MAVKPNIFIDVLRDLKDSIKNDAIVVSIALSNFNKRYRRGYG